MLDLIHYVLANDSAVTAIVGTRIFADFRNQTTDKPAVTYHWIATDDDYALGADTCTNRYTVEIVGYAGNMVTAHNLSTAIRNAVLHLQGTYTTAVPNSYLVTGSEVIDRNIEALIDLDTVECSVTVDIIASNSPS